MGAQKSIHAGKAKIDFNVDLTHKLCTALMLPPPFRHSSNPFSQVIGSLCIKHPNLFGKSEKLDVSWDKGLYDSNILIAYRKPRPEWLAQQSFVIQHVRPINDDGRSITRDLDGFPVTCSGNVHDSMVVLKQESSYAIANDHTFSQLNFQIEQGIPLLSKWLIFNRFKFVVSKGVKLGPAFLLTSLTGGSIVGDMAPYQAFAIGGLNSIRGYGEGAVGSGRSCLIVNSEIKVPMAKGLEGAIFMDCGTDLGSGHHVPGNPALRKGKPGSGLGFGYGLRFNSSLGQFRIDYAMNAFQQKTVYFGIGNVTS
ncbi:outer envelope protein 39, chloroplastic isoform X3 [Magnolia sinica]|uniref:outer envelope protein 39, chloroplastic isoform X3 n=1 Tax=Magnolia sinica TaxID=86752 RepID=UPI00265A397C|nr:outer envelope protein 39, chloroplastic isoform X3 [Magnolia sinica]